MQTVKTNRKPVAWLYGEIKTPPFSSEARTEAGELLARLQRGETLSMPHSRPMPEIGSRCHELRVKDAKAEWRIMYRLDVDAVIVLEIFQKKTRQTPNNIIQKCRKRLQTYIELTGGK